MNQTAKNEAHSSEYRKIRQIAVSHDIPYTTTLNGAKALVDAISWYYNHKIQVVALQDLLPVFPY